MADNIIELESRLGRKAPEPRGLAPLELSKFLDLKIPVKPMIMAPWLRAGSLSMVYAQAGRCKTFWLSALALSLRHGLPFLGWRPEKPLAGLYIDGEMVAEEFQARFVRLLEGLDGQIGELPAAQTGADLFIVTPDLHPNGIPKIDSPEGYLAITEILDRNPAIAYVILDNLSCLSAPEDANKDEGWAPVQELLLEMRRRGIAVLFAHHANKAGGQRGTSKKVDVLDNVIRLEMEEGEVSQGVVRVKLDFTEKSRFLKPEEKGPYTCLLGDTANGGVQWNFEKKVEELPKVERITEYLLLGMSPGDIANETGDNRSYVYRIKQKLEAEGKLETRKNRWNSKK